MTVSQKVMTILGNDLAPVVGGDQNWLKNQVIFANIAKEIMIL